MLKVRQPTSKTINTIIRYYQPPDKKNAGVNLATNLFQEAYGIQEK